MMPDQNSKENYFTLYSCCIPVKGAARTAVCDLQRNDFLLVPNVVYELLTEYNRRPIAEILEAFDHKHDDQILEYFDYLEASDMGFYSEEAPTQFPELNLDYRNPNPLTNSILERDEHSDYALEPVVDQLSALRCNFVELRNYHALSLAEMHEQLAAFQKSTARGIHLIMRYHPDHTFPALKEFIQAQPRVSQILIHGHPEREISMSMNLKTTLICTKTTIESDQSCGAVDPMFFRCNIKLFTESQNHNSCLYKKVSVDKHGNVRNCPSMPSQYGHVSEVDLGEIIERKDFQQLWNVTKDDVTECKDCEFRYICHDCRAHLKDPDNMLSKPAKCTYNPYEATWESAAKTTEHTSA